MCSLCRRSFSPGYRRTATSIVLVPGYYSTRYRSHTCVKARQRYFQRVSIDLLIFQSKLPTEKKNQQGLRRSRQPAEAGPSGEGGHRECGIQSIFAVVAKFLCVRYVQKTVKVFHCDLERSSSGEENEERFLVLPFNPATAGAASALSTASSPHELATHPGEKMVTP